MRSDGEAPLLPRLDFSSYSDIGGVPGEKRLRVHDTMARLQVERSRVVNAMERGRPMAARLVGRGPQGINLTLARAAQTWRTLESIRVSGTAEQLQVSLPNNTYLMGRTGLRMTSIWHRSGLDPEVRLMLSGEDPSAYFFGYALVQMKIIDGRSVLLDGPTVRGQTTVIDVWDDSCLAAAREYWAAVVSTTYPCAAETASVVELSARQRRVVALMLAGPSDDEIARRLGVSVRTVRSEIAAVLSILDAPNRFVAGVRLRERLGVAARP